MNTPLSSPPFAPFIESLDWSHLLPGSLACLCCVVTCGVLFYSSRLNLRSPLSRLTKRMAMWALFAGIVVGTMVLFPQGGDAFVGSARWIALLALCASTVSLVVRLSWIAVTQERQQWEAAANELRESKNRFELARMASSGGWWEWRVPDNELWCDHRFLQLMGGENSKLQDQSHLRWERLLHPDDVRRVYRELTKHLERPDEVTIDCRVQAAGDTYRWCRIKAVSIQQPDKASFVLAGSIQDIDDFRRTEDHLRELSQYISKKHKMESLGEVTENVAHEFKNVLQAISGQLQFAERHIPEESEARSELTMATSLIEQASEISQELLQFSSGDEQPARRVHPNSTLRSLQLILRPMLADDIQLQVVPLRHKVRIAIPSTSLQQALLNLCLNARDAMPGGGVLTVSATLLRRSARSRSKRQGRRPRRYVCFSVSDTGPGIPQEIQGRVFEPFFTTKDAGKGTGLGLAIVADIAKKYRGHVELESRPGGGTTFQLLLPVARAKEKPSATMPTIPMTGRT